MRFRLLTACVLLLGCLSAGSQRHSASASSPARRSWILTWSDEFDGPMGAAPDPTKWVIETGGSGWGNNELEYYASRRKNVRQQNGNLVIEAVKEKYTGPDGIQHNYTSARLKTQGRFAQKYGRFEARIKVALGRGMWSAFWLLGDDFSKARWPACGEIDIMEHVGAEPSTIRGSMHGPGYSGGNPLTAVYILPDVRFSDDFHIFAAEWEPQAVRFYVDGQLFETRTPADLASKNPWVFDHPFFVVLNLAVGGTLGGTPDDSVFPQEMLVDYVRVYSRATDKNARGSGRELGIGDSGENANLP